MRHVSWDLIYYTQIKYLGVNCYRTEGAFSANIMFAVHNNGIFAVVQVQ